MSLVNDFSEFLVDSCQIKKQSSVNKFGEITFGSATTYACFVNNNNVLVEKVNAENGKVENVISKLQIYIDKNPDIDISDVVIYNSVTLQIKDIKFNKEFNVAYSTEILT